MRTKQVYELRLDPLWHQVWCILMGTAIAMFLSSNHLFWFVPIICLATGYATAWYDLEHLRMFREYKVLLALMRQ